MIIARSSGLLCGAPRANRRGKMVCTMPALHAFTCRGWTTHTATDSRGRRYFWQLQGEGRSA